MRSIPGIVSPMANKSHSFISSEAEAVEFGVRGSLVLHPGLLLHEKQRGGSGHEPAHVGYVGNGMLDASVCGNIFASPNMIQIETGLSLIRSPKGILVIVKNYTGDKLNFTLSAQRFRFATGIPVRLVIVADDVSIGRSKSARLGRRGLAGTVLVHKVAGGAAAAGRSLDEVAGLAEFVGENMGTIGVALNGCDIPGRPHVERLEDDEVELGIGIHNEPGSRRISPRPSIEALVEEMLCVILKQEDEERNYLKHHPSSESCDVVVLINNLGGLSQLEIASLMGHVGAQLGSQYNIKLSRAYAGTFLSALNGPGFSITLLSLPKSNTSSAAVLEYLDAPTDALGWTSSIPSVLWTDPAVADQEAENASVSQAYSILPIPCNPSFFEDIVKSIHTSLVAAEPEITRLDNIMGDGDCGTTLVNGSVGILQGIKNKKINTSNLSEGIMAVATILSQEMGGTSGALYAVFFTALASALCANLAGRRKADFIAQVDALSTALHSLMQVTAAREGDRTMMDALIPFVNTLEVHKESNPVAAFSQALDAARAGCKITENVQSKFGRSTYVGAEESGASTQGFADPGACGVVAILEGLLASLKRHFPTLTL
ncbi:hypothetical protein GQX73_g1742 [Xylaria multiplex]|uniref:Dihydroxyacetone kinase n=1 Tax=Xylaria multiplex TaxID=323545 RepID=A0A7C8IVE0_9PEZI|nr:hypothetical protein GQX73_g1742 [Xylaria multiplex]